MRSSPVAEESPVVRASNFQCTGCNVPGFDPSIRRHSGIWGAADEAVLNTVQKKIKISPKKIFKKKEVRGLSTNFHIHVSGSDLYNFRIGPHIYCSRIGRPIVGIYKSLTDTWMVKLGLRPCSSFSGNICFEFSVLCLCSTGLLCVAFFRGWQPQLHPLFSYHQLIARHTQSHALKNWKSFLLSTFRKLNTVVTRVETPS